MDQNNNSSFLLKVAKPLHMLSDLADIKWQLLAWSVRIPDDGGYSC